MPDPTNCAYCGKRLKRRLGAGKPRKYCNPVCRKRDWDAKHLVLLTEKVEKLIKAAEAKK